MGKGRTRRPSFVSRKEFDEAYERTFRGKAEPEPVPEPPKAPLQMDPCDVAAVMTEGFPDQRSRA